jgi:hypothetical protein
MLHSSANNSPRPQTKQLHFSFSITVEWGDLEFEFSSILRNQFPLQNQEFLMTIFQNRPTQRHHHYFIQTKANKQMIRRKEKSENLMRSLKELKIL